MLRNRFQLLLLASIAALASTGFAQQPQPMPPNDYGNAANWLCRPGLAKSACDVDLSTTVVAANGTTSVESWRANPDAAVDCFYVYPTVSNDPTPNSDMSAGPEERSVVQQQFARFASQCRVYAPLYRQITLTALQAMIAGKPMATDAQLGYNDVLAAWNHYLAHDNQGRGVVLIGHSQGSLVLNELIANEIDGKPAQRRLISALLLGWNVAVPKDKAVPNDKDIGGAFRNIPVCRAATQIQCVLAFASFRANSPPPANTRFGKVPGDNLALCVNPAAFGGRGDLHAYLPASGRNSVPMLPSGAAINTPFVSAPGLLSAECVSNPSGTYLAITVHGDSADPRADDIAGDVLANGVVQKDWGLHLIDANLVMGNLVALVSEQGRAYVTAYEAAMENCKCKNRL